jgi:hypothetical protein
MTSIQNLPSVIPTDRAGLSKLKVVQLKAILRSRGLKVSGRKAELIDRILSQLAQVPEEIIGPGPQIGALSPVITAPITITETTLHERVAIPGTTALPVAGAFQSVLSPFPQMPTITKEKPVSPEIELPDISKLTISKPIISKPPKEKEEMEEEFITYQPPTVDLGPPMTKPTVKLPPVSPVTLPSAEVTKMPVAFAPPPQLTMPISPLAAPGTKVIVSGVSGIGMELPDISGPMGPERVMEEVTEVETEIKMPVLSTVIPSQGITLPPPPTAGFQLPPPIVVPPLQQTVESGKVGPGGLPIQTDLTTLRQVQEGAYEAMNINPRAFFQRKIETETRIPPPIVTKPVTKPTVSQLPPVTKSPLTALSPIPQMPSFPSPKVEQVALPTTTVTKKAPLIHMPKTITTVPIKPVVPPVTRHRGLPKFTFPTDTTVMKPIPLASPVVVVTQEISVAQTPQQQAVENIMAIDPTRLNPGRAKKDDNSYTVAELRFIAGSINLPKSGNKKTLVERIKAAIRKVNPNVVFLH